MNLYKECGWTTLSQRRQQHKLSFMYNLNTGMVSSDIQDLIYPQSIEISDYHLRNNRNISMPLSRTFISQNVCIPSIIRLWSSLEDDLKTYQYYKPLTIRSCCSVYVMLACMHVVVIVLYQHRYLSRAMACKHWSVQQ